MEGVGEVKKFVEKIVYTMVCTHTLTHTLMHALHPVSCPEIGPKKTAPVLVEPGTGRYVLLCCQPAGGGKQECSEAAERHKETSRLAPSTFPRISTHRRPNYLLNMRSRLRRHMRFYWLI